MFFLINHNKKLLEKFNNTKYILDNKINFSNIDKKIINNLSKKINIKIQKIDNKKKYFNSKIYVSNNPIKNQKKYICISNVLKDILNEFENDIDKIYFLKNLFKNQDIVVLLPGPSYKYLTNKQKKYLINNYITISVKYTINDLKKLNLYPTFFLKNNWSREFKFKDSNITVINGCSINNLDNNSTINIFLKQKISHKKSFNLIKKNIDIISWNLNNFKKEKKIYYYPMHIMCELVLPLCILLGIKNIYTVGWDLDYKYKKNSYFDPKIKLSKLYISKHIKNNTELIVLDNIKIILKKKNINIYKIKKQSPLNIKYKNILPS